MKPQTEQDADRAIREGRGRLINGRACRCEKAKAHRQFSGFPYFRGRFPLTYPGLFIIERKYGPVITEDEARSVLDRFGEMEFVRTIDEVERDRFRLSDGVLVQFKLYDDGQTAFQVSQFTAHSQLLFHPFPSRFCTMC
jgi:hypothetical protein